MPTLDWSQCPAVESVPGRLSGAWVFRNTRMPVSAVFENLEAGATIDEASTLQLQRRPAPPSMVIRRRASHARLSVTHCHLQLNRGALSPFCSQIAEQMHQGFLPVWVFREIQRCCRPFSL